MATRTLAAPSTSIVADVPGGSDTPPERLGPAHPPALDRATGLAAAQRPPVVVINCPGLAFMAGLAMGSLVALHNALRASGRRIVIA